jgi:hypothetical protein
VPSRCRSPESSPPNLRFSMEFVGSVVGIKTMRSKRSSIQYDKPTLSGDDLRKAASQAVASCRREHRYGERKAATEPGGILEDLNFQTAADYGSVARAFETSSRNEVLSFPPRHHRASDAGGAWQAERRHFFFSFWLVCCIGVFV